MTRRRLAAGVAAAWTIAAEWRLAVAPSWVAWSMLAAAVAGIVALGLTVEGRP